MAHHDFHRVLGGLDGVHTIAGTGMLGWHESVLIQEMVNHLVKGLGCLDGVSLGKQTNRRG